MKRIVAGFALSLAMGLPALASTIVTNGSFESGVLGNVPGAHGSNYTAMPGYGGWDVWHDLYGWTTVSGSGIEVQTNKTINEVDAQDGNYYLEMDSFGNSAMEQMVTLARGVYLLSFWYSPRMADAATNGVSYALGDLVSGEVNGPSAAEGTAVGGWTKIERAFKVKKAGQYALNLGGTGTSDSLGGLVDNVAIAAVPVPAAGLLLLGALGGLGALKRRRTV